MAEHNYTIAVDFDGVIHSYTSPWVSAEVIPDPPVEGAISWLNRMAVKFTIVIHTTRGKTAEGRQAVLDYLMNNGYRTDVDVPEVTAEKPPALIYLDDRAWRFNGVDFPDADQIHRAKPWNKLPPMSERRHKRDVLLDFTSSPDAILNALHQEGWAVVPRA